METNAQFSIGLQGGSNLSEMDFTNNPKYKFTEVKYSQGFIGGLLVQFLNEKHAGVQAELNYTQRGWIEKDTIAGNNLKFKNQVNYLELPILTHVNVGGGNFRMIFDIGPYIAYALSANETITDLNNGSEEHNDITFNKDEHNRFDYGLLAGGGFEYRMPFGKLATEVRYTIGLGNLSKIKFQESEVSQFRVLAILVRYTIPLNKGPELNPE